MIGALGALSFTAAATLTRLAPQFTAGLIDNVRPARLILEAGLYGIAMPLTAAAAGGLIGMMLWFRSGERADLHPERVHRALLIFTGVVVMLYTAIWVVDAARLPKLPQLLLHLGLTVLAVLAARSGCRWRCCTRRPTRRGTGRCCASTANGSSRTCRSAHRAG